MEEKDLLDMSNKPLGPVWLHEALWVSPKLARSQR